MMSGMDSGVEGPDVSSDLCKFSKVHQPWDSREFQKWWSEVHASSSLVVGKSLYPDDWRYLMYILTLADVSRIEVLVINLPRRCNLASSTSDVETINAPVSSDDIMETENQLGTVLLRREFSMLRTLRILATDRAVLSDSLGGESLARAVREDRFKNLRTLALPPCTHSGTIVALTASRIPQLTSFSTSWVFHDELLLILQDTTFSSGCFKNLQHLDLSDIDNGFVFMEYFSWVIKSGNLPSITSLRLGNSLGIGPHLGDFVLGLKKWFSSLENLTLDGCGITSEEAVAMVSAMMAYPTTESSTKFALKRLDLHNNYLGYPAVLALLHLAHCDQLPHLQELNLSGNSGLNESKGSKSLVSLIKKIGAGSLPNLRNLKWENNKVLDADAEAIVQAFYADQSLTTEIHLSWIGVSDLSLRTKLKEYRDRNVRLVALREKLKKDKTVASSSDNLNDNLGDFLPLTSAKVFLCGYPGVGKTRLRKTLLRQIGKTTKFVWETRPNMFKQPRTRGIEISRIEEKKKTGKNVTLILWDLAGQHEYHVLHGTFLADLGLEGGKATTFILVFKAPFEADVEPKLLYWLRFAASSSLKHVKRHVVILLNCFNGRRCPDRDHRLWMALIKDFAKMFGDLLHIHPSPFIVDVRKAASVEQLKNHLFDHAQSLLRDVAVPRICVDLQEGLKGWSEGEKDNVVPILTWQAFEESWKLKSKGNHFSAEALKTAAAYLHEIGEIIYFEDKVVSEPRLARRSVLVPNPEWFCRKVVGELLLPKEMLEGGASVKVCADGSISVVMFQAFFEHLLVKGTQSDDVISMLELVGLCYKKGTDKIIVPALIREDDYHSISWDGKGSKWVMGRCLTVEDKGRNAIPMTLFRRLQVELALHPNFGGRGDSEYTVGKSFSSFKVGELLVLIQFDVDHSDPNDDRIDILVKNLRMVINEDPEDSRSAEVECICEIMQKLEDLCVTCCPGMTYDIKVVEPSSAANRVDKMSERKLMSLREIKDLVIRGKKYLSWRKDGHHIKLKTFLSENELKEILGSQVVTENPRVSLVSSDVAETSNHSLEVTVKQGNYDDCKEDALTMGLLTKDSLQQLEQSSEWNSSCSRDGFMERADVDRILHAIQDAKQDVKQTVREEVHLTREHVDKRSAEFLLEIQHKHDVLVKSIQAQEAFSIQEKERSVPRYMFLSKKRGHSRVWISLTEAFQNAFHLHLLCEAHFENGFLHEVDPQEGIELKKPKTWLVKVSPWLRRSLQVAIMVGKTVGNVYLPGVFNLIPDCNLPNERGALAKAVDSAATMLLEEDGEIHQNQDVPGHCGSAAQPVNVNERLIAQEVIKDLISEVGYVEFATKIRLRRVLLRTTVQQQADSSQQKERSVLWICDDCCKRYGNRATAI